MCLTCALNVQGLPLTTHSYLPPREPSSASSPPHVLRLGLSCRWPTRSSPCSFRPAQEAWEGSRALVSNTKPGKEQSQAEPQPAGCLSFSWELDSGSPRGGIAWGVAGGQESPPALSQSALRTIPGFHRQPHGPRILSPSPWLHLNILEARTQGHIISLQK